MLPLLENKVVSVMKRERKKHYQVNLEEQIFAGFGWLKRLVNRAQQ